MMNILSFQNVFLIKEDRQILNDISWTVKEKENWAILGLNGAGKTTLLKMIYGDIWPTKGKLEVLGKIFGHTNIPVLKRRIGWVSIALQDQFHSSDLVEEIVLSGKFASIGLYESYSEDEMQEAKAEITRLGGTKLIGKPYCILSQGERQLVLIARALMAKPELLILDEPCNGLDLFAREVLLEKISKIAHSLSRPSLLFVSHYTEELLPCFGNVLLLKGGSIYASGRREKILSEKILTSFYEKPIKMIINNKKRILIYPRNKI
ncbi:ABC transporter ATP-binding protein [Oenococcus sp. UCMA 17063]|nr:ABC transporter ATP-binding protein [Oenococcus sp. UCMA 17063]